MKTLDESIEIIRQNISPLMDEEISIFDSLNRVLSIDIYSTQNIPPFNKSAMDGFACKKSDLPGELRIVDYIPAGKVSTVNIKTGECAKIMTGATVPEGADMVLMKEHVEIVDETTIKYSGNIGNQNICFLGEDLKENDLVLKKGSLLKSMHIAVLTGLGISKISVYKRPQIAVLSTGSELIEPGSPTKKGQIYNSNGHQLVNRISQLGFPVNYAGIVDDDYHSLKTKVETVFKSNDVLVISGGVSVGDLDLVPKVVEDMGFTIHLTEMSTKPGKHTLFTTNNGKYVLGLPGNPVSSYVQLEVVGQALLFGLMGYHWLPLRVCVNPSQVISRKKSDRLEFIPVRFNDNGMVERIEYHGSAHLHALTFADALLEIPLGVIQISPSETAYVRPI